MPIKRILFLIPVLVFTISSCALEKRVHTAGYHIDWTRNNNSFTTKVVSVGNAAKKIKSPVVIKELNSLRNRPHYFEAKAPTAASPEKTSVNQPNTERASAETTFPKKADLKEAASNNLPVNEDHPKGKYEPWSVAGFVMTILGLTPFTWPLLIPGLIFSAIGFNKIKKNPQLKGRELALVAIIIFMVLLSIILVALLAWLGLLLLFGGLGVVQ